MANLEAMSEVDISGLLKNISVPTSLFHFVHDRLNTSIEEARNIASEIPGADLLALDGESHLILEDDEVWPVYVDELSEFLSSHNC